jgi:hypothetical protein
MKNLTVHQNTPDKNKKIIPKIDVNKSKDLGNKNYNLKKNISQDKIKTNKDLPN